MNGSYNEDYNASPSTSNLSKSLSRGRLIQSKTPYSPLTTPTIPRSNSISTPSQYQHLRASSSLNPNTSRPSKPIPLTDSYLPVPPLTKISESRYQAMYTTYPARMKLGTSSLMQPNSLAASGNGTNTPSGGGGGGSGSNSSRKRINYAEIEGGGIDDLLEDNLSGNEVLSKARRVSNVTNAMVPKRALGIPGVGGFSLNGGGGGGGDKTIWGDGKTYLGSLPPGNMVIVQPAKTAKHTFCTEDQLEEQALEESLLVPIQIDIDVDTFKIRDAFVWNVNEKLITPEAFARIFCDDLDIPLTWVAEVAKQITEQCEEQTGVAEIPVRSEEDELNSIEKDLRVILNLDVQIGTLHLVDRIEWDLSSSLTPELFATLLVQDLALTSSASPLIAHAIHEELFKHKKTCLELGLVGGGEDLSNNNKRKGARVLEGVWRDWNESQNYGPRIEVLSIDEMDRLEEDRERAIRRAKRDRVSGTGRRRR